MILYRGTPEPEDFPRIRTHPCIFFAGSAYAAANYGDYVQAYEVGDPKIFRFDYKDSQRLISQYLDLDPSSEAFHVAARELGIHPTDDWIGYVSDELGFDGYQYDRDIICLFEHYVLKLPVELIRRSIIRAR